METVNASTIKRASYATLSQLCKEMGVEFKNQPKKQLIELLLTKLEQGEENTPAIEEQKAAEVKNEANSKKPDKAASKEIKVNAQKVKKAKPIKNSDNAKKATKQKETKSSKILAMYLKGSKISEISEALSAHPSFCYTVIGKHKAKK
jgi:hypothetical protein